MSVSWRAGSFGALFDELRLAVRSLLRRPVIGLVTVLIASLGVAASVLTFAAVNTAALRSPSLRSADRLVQLWDAVDVSCAPTCVDALTRSDAQTWQAQLRSVRAYAVSWSREVAVRGSDAETSTLAATEPGFFPTLGTRPLLGRLLIAGDFDRTGPSVGIVSYGMWKRLFGGRRDVLGRVIDTEVGAFTIVGVASGEFDYPQGTDLWVPASTLADVPGPAERALLVVARLRDGMPPAALMREMARLRGQATTGVGRSARVAVATPFSPASRSAAQGLWLIFGMIAITFLTVLVNLAVIFTVRAVGRLRETAVRAALGATAARLVAPVLAEGVVLTALAGGVGVWLALVGKGVAERLVATRFDVSIQLVMDGHVVAFALLSVLAVSIAVALVPATIALRADLQSALRAASHSASSTRGLRRVRDATIVMQVTASYVLVVSAGLFLLSFLRTQQIDLGFDPRHVLVGEIRTDTSRRDTVLDQRSIVAGRVRTLVDLSRVRGYTVWAETYPRAPLPNGRDRLLIEGRASLPFNDIASSAFYVTPSFFDLFRLPVTRGRILSATGRDAAPVAVVNEAAASMWWPKQEPLGKRIRLIEREFETPWLTVVGVAADRNTGDLALRLGLFPTVHFPYVYVPLELAASPRLRVATPLFGRTDLRIAQMERDIGAVLPTGRVRMQSNYYDRMLKRGGLDRLLLEAKVLAGSALFVVFVTLIGVFGSVSEVMASQARAIGIRLALGSPQRAVMLVVMRRSMSLAMLGLLLGIGATLAAGHVLSRFLIGMQMPPIIALFAVGAGLALAIVGASLVAAGRILRLDPATVLRMD